MDTPVNSIFSSPVIYIFNATCSDEHPFTCQCEKEDKKGLRVSNFPFSNDVMAVKGLSTGLFIVI